MRSQLKPFLTVAVTASFLLLLTITCIGCHGSDDSSTPKERTLTVTMLIPRANHLQQTLSELLNESGDALQLSDGTKISISLVSEDDLTGRSRVINGTVKPQLWVTRHPALADLHNEPVSTLGVKNFTCSPLGESAVTRIGAGYADAKYIRIVNPEIDVGGLLAIADVNDNISKVVSYPSNKILQAVFPDNGDARVIAEPDTSSGKSGSRTSLDEKLILSSCLADSELFSTREIVAAETLNGILKKASFPDFKQNAVVTTSTFDVSATERLWQKKRPQQQYIVVASSSSTMLGKNASLMEAIVKKLLENKRQEDTVTMVTYDKDVTIHDGAMGPSDILRGLSYNAGSELVAAIDKSLKLADNMPTTMVVFSDSVDESESKPLEQKLALLQQRNLQLYGFAFGGKSLSQLSKYSGLVGGETVSADQLQGAMALITNITK